MKYSKQTPIRDIAATERGRRVLATFCPQYAALSNIDGAPVGSLGRDYRPEWLAPGVAERIVEAMNGPIEAVVPEARDRASLDEVDRASFRARCGALAGEAIAVVLREGEAGCAPTPRARLPLDGEWQLAPDRDGRPHWPDAVPYEVPGSVHAALFRAGRLPDPVFGRNQEIAVQASYRDWWLRKRFAFDDVGARCRLTFEGICNRCQIWLNGRLLSAHEGMFGGPDCDVTGLLRPENELVVKLCAIPREFEPSGPIPGKKPHRTSNGSWKNTVVANNVYGWHYANLPSLGIWNHVGLEVLPDVALQNPFLATIDAHRGAMRLSVEFAAERKDWRGALYGEIRPLNFEGAAYAFEKDVSGADGARLLLSFDIPAPKLWWPNGMGAQNLYQIELTLSHGPGLRGETFAFPFGVRTIEMRPLADGPHPSLYNWRFAVNGKPLFVKGAGWCTMDALLDFSPARYERFLRLAQLQNCQMLRAWGAGMPETDDFYHLCDRYGLLVMQEWPTAWDSHQTQPLALLEETVVRNTLRLRNHPSLALYCAGNESMNPYGEAIDMMGRCAIELDGTRAFHRGEPWGGSIHNYDAYWGRQSLDAHANLAGCFLGEFGIASTPCAESVRRYLPAAERDLWPPREDGAFEYHTPIFGTADDISRLKQMVGYFAPPDCSFEQMTVASQLAQVAGVRHALERARFRYPYCGGALYYKLNDNFPAMSWASVDWYGAPKLSHYAFAQSFAPTATFVLPATLHFSGTAQRLPVVLVDDMAAPGDAYEVRARAFDGRLSLIAEQRFAYAGDASVPDQIGVLALEYEDLLRPPLLLRLELSKNGQSAFDTFYFFNFQAAQGCLFALPRTALRLAVSDGCARVANVGKRPAVGVCVERPGHADTFTAWENFFWLDPGEERRIRVDCTEGLRATALNAEPTKREG